MKRAVFFFCGNLEKDYVAPHVFKAVKEMYQPSTTDLFFDEKPVLEYVDSVGNAFLFVETNEVFSHAYESYLPALKAFDDFDFAGWVNWHAGAKAPEKILTVHSIGDVPSGYYAPSNPTLYRNMLIALRNAIDEYDLNGWNACTEATHWSGIVYGNDPELIPEFHVPNYDIEIGSSTLSWSNATAAKALASALVHVFDSDIRPKTLLAAGGVHFEDSYSVCAMMEEYPVMCAHILPNQWLVSGEYNDEDGIAKMMRAVESINGGIDGVVFHDNLGGIYKAVCREVAKRNGVPSFKHKVLRDVNRIKENLK